MSLREAVDTIVRYLCSKPISFEVYRAWEPVKKHFRVAVHQTEPTDDYCTFEIAPTDRSDVWDVKEVATSSY